jgi:hypothetical protein
MLPNTLEPREMSGSITLIWMIWHLVAGPTFANDGRNQRDFMMHGMSMAVLQLCRSGRTIAGYEAIHVIRKGQAYGTAAAAKGGLLHCFILGLFSAVTV